MEKKDGKRKNNARAHETKTGVRVDVLQGIIGKGRKRGARERVEIAQNKRAATSPQGGRPTLLEPPTGSRDRRAITLTGERGETKGGEDGE
jgi:hypothetical protein